MNLPYDLADKQSIINFAKKLISKTLKESCSENILKFVHSNNGNKGNFGQILEKFYFLYEPNSDSQPDFPQAKLELKSTPLKQLKNKKYCSKERLVLNIINYLEVADQDFNTSSFWKKNSQLLIVFYLHNTNSNILDYMIKLVDEWTFSDIDLEIIKRDWEFIKQKIKDGKAHELSEGDTFYLGACTKGANASSKRQQPFSNILAKQRAYSLKQGYVNHIIASIANDKTAIYGKLIPPNSILKEPNIEQIVMERFKPYYNQTIEQILTNLNIELNQKSKNFYANLTKAILKINLKQKIEEFEKADIIVKTIRLKKNNLPKEDVSFPAFQYTEIIKENWEESDFKNILEHKFLFVFFQFENKQLILRKIKFWNMPYSDIEESKKVWTETQRVIKEGYIVKQIVNDRNQTYFPHKDFNLISHVRPHANNKKDTYPLPKADKLTGKQEYMKHSFWLNNRYVKEKIYLLP